MQFLNAFFFNDFLVLAFVFIALSVIVILIGFIRKRNIWTLLLVWILPLFSIAVAGLSVGLLSGNSRVPVVAALVPAFLSLLSGYNIYLFSKNSNHKIIASLFTVVFSIFLIQGISSGSHNRGLKEAAEKEYEQLLVRYETEMELYKLRVITKEGLTLE